MIRSLSSGSELLSLIKQDCFIARNAIQIETNECVRGSESPVFVKSTGIKLRISDLLIFNDYFRKRISTKIFKILQILCNKVIKYSYVSLETKFSRFLLTKRNRSIFFLHFLSYHKNNGPCEVCVCGGRGGGMNLLLTDASH